MSLLPKYTRNDVRRRRAVRLKLSRFESLEARCLLAANQFAVIGDYGDNGANELAVANLVKSWQPGFVITVGDNNYSAGSSIDTSIGKYYQEFIGNYTGGFGPGSATNRFFPAMGNAEWNTGSTTPYLNYFTLPGNERYYDYVQGPIHFFVVDSDPHEPDGITANSIQGQWLQNALAQSTSLYNLVYFHHPAFSSGASHGSTPELQWPFKAWGADAVFSGHDHDYERLNIGGLTYFVDGVGGRTLTAFAAAPLAGSQARFNSAYGAMRVTFSDQSLLFEFFSVTSGGTLSDSYEMVPNTVRARQAFYNNSKFDGQNAAANAADDGAIAANKQALLPGGTATAANYTSYSRGLNGIMVDIARPPATLTAADFEFRVGNSNTPASWSVLAVSPSISVRANVAPGVDRVTLTWPDGTITNEWLQVTVKRTLATGLPAPDVFYFGNAIGESGDSAANAAVNSTDEVGARTNTKTFLNLATLGDAYDFNRDGFVNAVDQILARSNSTTLATALRLITVPGSLALSQAIEDSEPLIHGEFDSAVEIALASGLAAPKLAVEPKRSAPSVDVLVPSRDFGRAYSAAQTASVPLNSHAIANRSYQEHDDEYVLLEELCELLAAAAAK